MKRPLSKRAKARLQKMRRDPFGRLSLEIGKYLETVGWTALVVGNPRIQQQAGEQKMNYEFVVKFTGGKKKAES
jgi:hypothetical protein